MKQTTPNKTDSDGLISIVSVQNDETSHVTLTKGRLSQFKRQGPSLKRGLSRQEETVGKGIKNNLMNKFISIFSTSDSDGIISVVSADDDETSRVSTKGAPSPLKRAFVDSGIISPRRRQQ